MKRIPLAALLVALAVSSHAPSAEAQATTPAPMTVDEVNVTVTTVRVKGVPQGGDTAIWATFDPYSYASGTTEGVKLAALDRCHRSLLLALSKPGQYKATVTSGSCSVALVAP